MTPIDAGGLQRSLLRLGTRRSPLALAQSRQVGRRIEDALPGVRVELVGIETRGDRILDTALWKTQGRDFFSAELDEALLSGRVDLTVHSLKDLALDRSGQLAIAAIPPREDPRDIVLFHPRVLDHLHLGRPIRIGTSSPRRLALVPPFLQRALPARGHPPVLTFVEIRGNLDSRLRRLRLPESDLRSLDAVVVALAGLSRLHADTDGAVILGPLLKDLRAMVLPLRECPGAPGQGALAVEVRSDDVDLREAVHRLHDPITERHVLREREVLREWGGGCHQALGATASEHPDLGTVLHVRGRRPSGELVHPFAWEGQGRLPSIPSNATFWDGTRMGLAGELRCWEPVTPSLWAPGRRVFTDDWRHVPDGMGSDPARLVTADVATWFDLADRGHWVVGCADGLGLESIRRTAENPVLGAHEEPWLILTREGFFLGTQGLETGPCHPPHGIPDHDPSTLAGTLHRATHLFWASANQFLGLRPLIAAFAPGARHACCPGAAAERLKAEGLHPDVFPSPDDWRRWIGHS